MSSVSKLQEIERRQREIEQKEAEEERQFLAMNRERIHREEAEHGARRQEALSQGLVLGNQSGVLPELEEMKRALPKSAIVNNGSGSFELRFDQRHNKEYYNCVSVYVEPNGTIHLGQTVCRNYGEFTTALAEAVHHPERVSPSTPKQVSPS